jgi:hypothetical protein
MPSPTPPKSAKVKLSEVNKLMDKVIGQLSNIGTEALASTYLAKIEGRRKRAAARQSEA